MGEKKTRSTWRLLTNISNAVNITSNVHRCVNGGLVGRTIFHATHVP